MVDSNEQQTSTFLISAPAFRPQIVPASRPLSPLFTVPLSSSILEYWLNIIQKYNLEIIFGDPIEKLVFRLLAQRMRRTSHLMSVKWRGSQSVEFLSWPVRFMFLTPPHFVFYPLPPFKFAPTLTQSAWLAVCVWLWPCIRRCMSFVFRIRYSLLRNLFC